MIGGGSGGGGGLVPLVSMPVLIPFVDISLSVPSGGCGCSRSTPQMELPAVPTESDVPASLDLSIVYLESPFQTYGHVDYHHLVRTCSRSLVQKGWVLAGSLLVVSLVLCLSHHRVQGCQGHRGLEKSVC
jgi:hypothetical protein